MRKVELTIEQAVEKWYPTAKEEKKKILIEQYRKVIKDQKITTWEYESPEEEQQTIQQLMWHVDMLKLQWAISKKSFKETCKAIL